MVRRDSPVTSSQRLNGEREKENPSSPYCHYVRAFRPEKTENPGKILLANAETFLCRGMLVLAGAS